MKALKILFFIRGAAPTAAQYEEAHALNANVNFRNALAIGAEDNLETCDGVAGDVPPMYSAKFPDAEAALETRSKKLAALSAKVGDEKAPKKGKTAAAKTTAATGTTDAKAPAKGATPPAKPAGWTANK